MILVHGFPEIWYSWHHQIKPLSAAGFRVVAPNVRGYGVSDKPHEVEEYDMVSIIADLVGLIDHFAEDQAILIGQTGVRRSVGIQPPCTRNGKGCRRAKRTLSRPNVSATDRDLAKTL